MRLNAIVLERLKKLRLTQETVAQELGISTSQFNLSLSGHRSFSKANLHLLAGIIGEPVGRLEHEHTGAVEAADIGRWLSVDSRKGERQTHVSEWSVGEAAVFNVLCDSSATVKLSYYVTWIPLGCDPEILEPLKDFLSYRWRKGLNTHLQLCVLASTQYGTFATRAHAKRERARLEDGTWLDVADDPFKRLQAVARQIAESYRAIEDLRVLASQWKKQSVCNPKRGAVSVEAKAFQGWMSSPTLISHGSEIVMEGYLRRQFGYWSSPAEVYIGPHPIGQMHMDDFADVWHGAHVLFDSLGQQGRFAGQLFEKAADEQGTLIQLMEHYWAEYRALTLPEVAVEEPSETRRSSYSRTLK